MLKTSLAVLLVGVLVLYAPALVDEPHHAATHHHYRALSARRGQLAPLAAGHLHYTLNATAGASAPLVLVLHGISVSGYSVAPLAQRIAAGGCRTLVPDLYGRGHSAAADDRPHDDAFYVQQVAELLDHVGAERVHIVAMSMGGAVALAFANAAHERVLSLSLLAPAGVPFDLPLAGRLLELEPLGSAVLRTPLGKWLVLRRVLPSFADALTHADAVARLEHELAWHHGKRGWAHMFASTVNHFKGLRNSTAAIAALGRAPRRFCVTVFWGKRDATVPFAPGAAVIGELVPHANVVLFEHTGHSLIYERLDTIAKHTLECIRGELGEGKRLNYD